MNEPAGTSNEHPAPNEHAPEIDSGKHEARPGAQLLAERRAQGMSLGDIARQLKLSVRQVEALERDDYAAFAGMVFVRGFMRNYAKLLHVDADALLARLQPSAAPEEIGRDGSGTVPAQRDASTTPARLPGLGWIAGALVLLVLVVAAIYEGRQKRAPAPAPIGTIITAPGASPQLAESPPPGLGAPAGQVARAPAAPGRAGAPRDTTTPFPAPGPQAPEAAPAPQAPQAAPAPEAPPRAAVPPGMVAPSVTTAPLASTPPDPTAATTAVVTAPAVLARNGYSVGGEEVQLRLVFEDESWVEIKDATGDIIFSRLNEPGTERVVRGHPPFAVVVGNAHGVRLSYRDRPVDLEPHTRVDVARVVLP